MAENMSSTNPLQLICAGLQELDALWEITKTTGSSYLNEKFCLFPFLQGSNAKRSPQEAEGEKNISPQCPFFPLQLVPPLPEDLKQIALAVPKGSSLSKNCETEEGSNQGKESGQNEHSTNKSEETSDGARVESADDSTHFPSHCQLPVVRADVKRSLWELYPESDERDVMRQHLTHIILRITYHSAPVAHYTQGMNDLVGHVMFLVCSFREKVMGLETTSEAASRLSDRLELTASLCQSLLKTLWFPFVQHDLQEVDAMSYALHTLLSREDRKLWKLLQRLHLVQHPHYVLSWMLTWYMAGLSQTKGKMLLLMHFLKGSDALEPIYIGSALLLSASRSFQDYVKHELMEKGGMSVDEIWGLAFQKLSSLPSAFIEKGDVIGVAPSAKNKLATSSLNDSLNDSMEARDAQILYRIQLLIEKAKLLRSKYGFIRTEEEVVEEFNRFRSFPFSLFYSKSHKKSFSPVKGEGKIIPKYYCTRRRTTLAQHIVWCVLPLTIMTVLVLYNRYQKDINHIIEPIITTYAASLRFHLDRVVSLRRELRSSQNVTS